MADPIGALALGGAAFPPPAALSWEQERLSTRHCHCDWLYPVQIATAVLSRPEDSFPVVLPTLPLSLSAHLLQWPLSLEGAEV